MDSSKIVAFIENSFIKSLLVDSSITDISYNGDSIFYQHNLNGRLKSDINVGENEVRDFLRQIAFLCEKQFSFQNPILDVSAGKYRINAVHHSIARKQDEPVVNFAIRIASSEPRITDENGFMPIELQELFKVLLHSHCSLIIGGITGSGKTEFQKYLLRKLEDNQRVIIIDNILELDQVRLSTNLDVNSWQVDDRNPGSNINALVRNALRSNPDWLIVAEARGAEMLEVLNSALTGHPIITTIHALDVVSLPNRIGRMVMMNDKKMDLEGIQEDIRYHFHYYVYLKKENDDQTHEIRRFISSIGVLDENGQMRVIYHRENNQHLYQKIPQNRLKLLSFSDKDTHFYNAFVKEDGYEKDTVL